MQSVVSPVTGWRSWVETLITLIRDKGVMLLLLGGPFLYGFYYPWFYASEVVRRVPVAVVDQDHSQLSRQIIRFAQASPRLDVLWVGQDESAARQAVERGELQGYLLLPADFKAHVLHGRPAVATIQANGAYPLISKNVQQGLAEAVGVVSAGVEIRQLQAHGQSPLQAQASRDPVRLQTVALFNPTEGYGSFVVPAVALLILQQTLLMGAAMATGTWVQAGLHRVSARAWLGRLLAFSLMGWLSGVFYFGWIFWMNDYPRGTHPLDVLVLLAVYSPAVSALGCLLGLWFGQRQRAMQVLLFTTPTMAFLAGFSWPGEALPPVLQWLRWLNPATSGIQAALRFNSMEAGLSVAQPYLLGLMGIGVSAFLAIWALTRGEAPRVQAGAH
jgi:ABC-2 type transport system permease protein